MASGRGQYYMFKTGCFDLVEDYKGTTSIVLGVVMVLFGLLSIAVGIGAICTLASGYYIGYGIWCGILFCFTGVMCVITGYKKNICIIVATCSCCVLNLCVAIVQLSIGIAAAINDSFSHRGDIQMKILEPGYLDYDIYYARNNPYKYVCSGPNAPFTWKTAWGPVDVILILCGFIVFFITLAAAIINCISANEGMRISRGNPFLLNEDPRVFGNESYMTGRKFESEPGLIVA